MDSIIEIENTKFWTDNSGILYCKLKNENPKYKLTAHGVKLYIDAIIKLSNGKAMPFLIDLRGVRGTFSSSAANLLAKDPSLRKLRISEAFIHDSIAIKILISSYKRIYDSNTPFNTFNNMESAKEYCVETKNEFYGSN